MGLPLPASQAAAHDGTWLPRDREPQGRARRACGSQGAARCRRRPIAARGTARHVAAAALSVEDACEKYIEAQRAKWKTASHVEQIEKRLRDYVYPVIGHLPIAEIKAAEVRQVLAPIWTTKNPTAGRVRQYMEDVTNWSIDEGIRADESNPFEIKRIKYAFPLGIHKPANHPALPFERAPAFLAELRAVEGVKARAMELVMLTAVRIADICGGGKAHSEPMRWAHVDLPGALWTVPDTKMGRPHVVHSPSRRCACSARCSDFAIRNPTTSSPAPTPAPCSTPRRCGTCSR